MTVPAPPARSGGQLVVEALRRHGVDLVFNVPGESFIPVLDALYDARNEIRLVTCRHEAAAATMAEAQGKLTGRAGICIVTRGPGATHASVGMHTAFQDSTPLILLIGQVERHALGREGFQEFDVHRLFGWTAKWTAEARDAAEIPQLLTRAFQIATSGRPGPVAISLPQDVLEEMAAAETLDPLPTGERRPEPDAIVQVAALIAQAERPLAIVGGGGWTDAGAADIARFLERQQIPGTVTFRRLGLLPTTHATYAGEMAYAASPPA
jgi:acetolactate synthase-1/2/3 large subunit